MRKGTEGAKHEEGGKKNCLLRDSVMTLADDDGVMCCSSELKSLNGEPSWSGGWSEKDKKERRKRRPGQRQSARFGGAARQFTLLCN